MYSNEDKAYFMVKCIRQENEKKFVLDGFLDAAQQFNKEFKEEIRFVLMVWFVKSDQLENACYLSNRTLFVRLDTIVALVKI